MESAARLWESWSRRQEGVVTLAYTEADRTLFRGLMTIRIHRGESQTILVTKDDARPGLEALQRQAQETVAATFATIASVPLPGSDRLRADLQRRWDTVNASYSILYDEAAKPRAQREIRRTAAWDSGFGELIDAISTVFATVTNMVRMADPEIGELAQIRRFAWQVRDRYGLQCLMLRPQVLASQPLDAKQNANLNTLRGGAQAGWTGMDEMLTRPGVSPEVLRLAKEARAVYDNALVRIEETIARFDGSGKPLMPPADWNTLCRAPFDPIIAIGLRSLDEAVERAGALVAEETRTLIMNAVLLAVLLAAAAVGVLTIRRRFSRPVGQLLGAVGRLADGDYATPVDRLANDDELGRLAGALESLRQGAAEARRLSAEQEARRTAELERAGRMESLCRGFDSTADRALGALGEAAQSLRDTATRMRTLASGASTEAGAVAAAAEQATANVQTVAAATEELTASIGEISERVQSSAITARDAVDQARKTNATVEALSESAQRIGEVVKLISSIASQTNLLALNATIEAARAGEAGKGFAVVAQEVKNLANQTGKATEEIAQQVAAIQNTTGDAVEAIRGITRSIAGIDEMATAIAAAVQQQGAATQEIARNVQRAAQGTQQVTSTIGAVAGASQDTGRAADEVLDRVERMVGEVGGLRHQVGDFLGNLRAV
ncbi:methyl-accepting chemotaxis protein [Azospirillum sp. RWY-5-1]|uniref:methyl-accepting chemotaxis protein n=1 Tax=Azospirillum oleiclasticum TaxID=2735135 RepID=UPI0015D504EE|nr:methyl-accepting chemotaxis protein [Azospirillum oleiclasticum]